MKQTCPWLLTALVFTAACGGRTSLDAYEDGVPAYLLGAIPSGSDDVQDAGMEDAAEAGSLEDAAPEAAAGEMGGVGDPCESDDECDGDAPSCLQSIAFAGVLEIDFPGGYCTETGCQDDADCPAGSACFGGAGTPGCNKLCESDSDCRQAEGYNCATIPLSGDTRTFCQPEFDLGGLGF